MQPLYMRFNQHKRSIRLHDRLKLWSEHVKLNHNGCVVKAVISVLLRKKCLTLQKFMKLYLSKNLI